MTENANTGNKPKYADIERENAELRSKVIDVHQDRKRAGEWEVDALLIKAWNYYVSGKTLKLLTWRPGANEKFPVPRGCTH